MIYNDDDNDDDANGRGGEVVNDMYGHDHQVPGDARDAPDLRCLCQILPNARANLASCWEEFIILLGSVRDKDLLIPDKRGRSQSCYKHPQKHFRKPVTTHVSTISLPTNLPTYQPDN